MSTQILEIQPKELKFLCKFVIGRWSMLIIFFMIWYLCDRHNNHLWNLLRFGVVGLLISFS